MVDKRSRGRRCHAPPPSAKTLHSPLVLPPPPPLRDGRRVSQVQELCWEQKNNSAKATSSMEFMSCSSSQGHCGTQTRRRDFLRFFILELRAHTHTRYRADRKLIYSTWQKCQAGRRISSELSRRGRTGTSNRTRPADPSCNQTVSCTHDKLTT